MLDLKIVQKLPIGPSVERVADGRMDRLPRLTIDEDLNHARSTATLAAVSFLQGHPRVAISERLHMPKRGAGTRPIDVLQPAQRAAYVALVEALSKDLPPGGRGGEAWDHFREWPKRGEEPYDESCYLVDLDIAACYEYVRHDILMHELIARTLNVPVVEALIEILAGVYPAGVGLPQMIPTSDILADVYLQSLERRIAVLFPVLRYADDFKVVLPTWEEAGALVELFADYARDLGLVIASDKVFIRKLSTYWQAEDDIAASLKQRLRRARVFLDHADGDLDTAFSNLFAEVLAGSAGDPLATGDGLRGGLFGDETDVSEDDSIDESLGGLDDDSDSDADGDLDTWIYHLRRGGYGFREDEDEDDDEDDGEDDEDDDEEDDEDDDDGADETDDSDDRPNGPAMDRDVGKVAVAREEVGESGAARSMRAVIGTDLEGGAGRLVLMGVLASNYQRKSEGHRDQELIGAALHDLKNETLVDVPMKWLTEIVFRDAHRLDQVVSYGASRSAQFQADLLGSLISLRLSPWGRVVVLAALKALSVASPSNQLPDELREWARGRLSDTSEVVRAEAAAALGACGSLSVEELVSVYTSSSELSRHSIAARIPRVLKPADVSMPSVRGLLAAVDSDVALVRDVLRGAQRAEAQSQPPVMAADSGDQGRSGPDGK